MTRLLTFLIMAVCLPLLYACGDDDGENQNSREANFNKNSTSLYPEAGRLEFPHLQNQNSLLLVHYAGGIVNYSVEWDYELQSQRWSCYVLDKETMRSATSRYYGNPQYPLDPDLPLRYYLDRPSDDYTVRDYFYGSGFDHGHICPSADRLYSAEANKQTFYLTNMQPQYNRFNAGLWENMETQVRQWGRAVGTEALYVCKGGTIDHTEDILMRISGRLIVPRYFFMALLLKNAQGYRALAFWAENENVDRDGDDLSKYAISIDELERRTGIDFFCNLPDDVENQVEKNLALASWGL